MAAAPPAPPPSGDSHAARNALVVIAVVVAGAALTWLAPILTPLALAVFLMLMIDVVARDLQLRVPALGGGASVGLAIALCMLVFGAVVFFIAAHAAGFAAKLFTYQPRLNALLGTLAHTLHIRLPRTVAALIAQLDPAKYLPIVAQGVQVLASNGFFVLVYLGFLLAARGGFDRKAVRLFHGREGRHEALQVFLRVRDALERYLWIQTLCGGLIALGSFALMMAIGLQDAFFWAFLIFVVGYIPIVGAAVGIGAPALFAMLQYPTIWPGVMLFGALLGLCFVVGNILMPRLQGRSLNIDPVMVLFSLAFWSAVWGVTGAFLSTPLTILVMLILAQFDGSRWIAILLSADGDPSSLGAPAHAPSTNHSRKRDSAPLAT